MKKLTARIEDLLTVLRSEGTLEEMIDMLLAIEIAFDDPSVSDKVTSILGERNNASSLHDTLEKLKLAIIIGSVMSNTILSLMSVEQLISKNRDIN